MEWIKKVDHIGIAVRNLDQALDVYKTLYGVVPIKIETLPEISVRMAFIKVGEVLVELLEPTEPGAGRIGKHLDEHGEGFHHLAYRVEKLDDMLNRLGGMGIPLRDRVPRDGGDNSRIAFVEPSVTHTVLTELVEREKEIERDAR
jgi:methylmalonyl-CoA/ethylmalonyl-CoA epimerase